MDSGGYDRPLFLTAAIHSAHSVTRFGPENLTSAE